MRYQPKPPTSSNAQPANQPTRATFDHENLHAYQRELEFISWVSPLIEEARVTASAKTREVCDQLDRASLSALLNTAEGNGKRQSRVRAKFFDDARGSGTECAACLDALVAKGAVSPARILEGKALLLEIVSMLCGLVDRFDGSGLRLHEDCLPYQAAVDEEQVLEKRKRGRGRERGRGR